MTSAQAPGIDAREVTQLADRLADAARGAILPYFRTTTLGTTSKLHTGFDPVTEADRAAESEMRAILSAERPADGILGEEFGEAPGSSGLTWVLDPIDGTRAFLCGAPTWGVLIALSGPEGPLYGVVDQPYTGERFRGGLGLAELEGPMGRRPLSVRRGLALGQATLATTFPEIGTEAERAAFGRVAAEVQLTRYGMDCYAYAMLAAGQIDLVIEAGLAPYDIHAPMAVIEAAGGIVTDWQGGPAHAGGRILAAADPALHRQAVALLAEA
ncbi:histidinol-phosphatase [Rhodosalinus halophilus]|uniref:Histidinol-phosphatase n=1 Tax=Rhodosalinus halophilus TaxID=2259333 RepID=A0A365U6K6_9RHOB|nr:histidinol-phosphatase [Rhodosalinus halophilus]RBI83878.1 histidinol-phosphatase [Rhodosalinus halophilus]